MRTFLEYQETIFRQAIRIAAIGNASNTGVATISGNLADSGNLQLRTAIKWGLNLVQDEIQRTYPRAHFLPRRTWTVASVVGTTEYRLDKDCVSLIAMWDVNEERRLQILTLEDFYDQFPDPTQTTADDPTYCVLEGFQTASLYDTGTVYFRYGRNTITGIGTTWTSAAHNGKVIRRVGDSVDYTFTFVSATSGTLDRVYEGKSSSRRSGASYGIEPAPRLHVLLHPSPVEAHTNRYLGVRRLPRLINDGDISAVCAVDDNALFLGGLWHATKYIVPHDEVQVRGRYADYVVARDAIGQMVDRTEFNEQITPYIC